MVTFIILAFALAHGYASAEQTCSISGHVLLWNASGPRSVSDNKELVSLQASQPRHWSSYATTRTDSHGVYHFLGLPPGTYMVQVEGVRSLAALVCVRPGETQHVDLTVYYFVIDFNTAYNDQRRSSLLAATTDSASLGFCR